MATFAWLFASLPILNLLLVILVIRQLLVKYQISTSWREGILLGTVLWGLWLTLLTEGASLFQALARPALIGGWSVSALGLLSVWLIFRPKPSEQFYLPPLSLSAKLSGGGILFIVGITGLLALCSAPNNWDSMSYHLSRVMHWMQNHSVAHYPTHELRQLYQSPWAEFMITHLQILSGSDRFANLVQWLSMVGSIVGSSLIAHQLGANREGQILTGLVVATIPMGILQATTTQTDYVAAYWLVCFVVFGLIIQQNFHWLYLLGLAGSLGLALLTKATAYIYAAPFVLWFGLFLLKTYRWSAWRPVLISGAIVLLINSGHYYRNAQLFDSPLRPDSLDVFYINQTFGPTVFISNIVRNIALHLNLPVPFLLTSLDSLLRNLHNLLGLDPSDPRTTWPGTTFVLNPFHIHEDTSGNLVHLLLLFITCAFIMSKSKSRCVFEYALLLVSAFLLFVSYLKWQPWHTRLHLPLFILWSPLVGLFLSQFFQQTIVYLTIGLLLLQALPFIVLNPFHPILYPQNIFNLSRTEQYFLPEPSLLPAYGLTSQTIREKNCHYVGTIFPDDAWEYPFWILLHENNYTAQIEALEVENPSNILQNQTFIPCAVICLRCQDKHITLYTEKFGESKLHYGSNFLFIQ